MVQLNGRVYDIQIGLFGASSKTPVLGKYDMDNAVQLVEAKVGEFELHESLLCPYFTGHFVYEDTQFSSNLYRILATPFLYANITFAMSKQTEQEGRPVNDEYDTSECFSETAIITRMTSSADEGKNEKRFRFEFSSVDALNFDAVLKPYSTFPSGDDGETVDRILPNLFAGCGLEGKFDAKQNPVTIRVPFVTAANGTLRASLEYLYRRSFDCALLTDAAEGMYFKIIYDHIDKKYKVWNYGSVGRNPANESPAPNKVNSALLKSKRVISCEMSDGGGTISVDTGSGKNIAVPMYSGNAFDVMRVLADRRYHGYDYIGNDFDGMYREVKQLPTSNLHGHWQPDRYILKTSLLDKSRLDKSLDFTAEFSSWRENGSVYDAYNEIIFGSSYLYVRSEGFIGRRPGDPVTVDFLNSTNTSYDRLRGDYFITDVRTRYLRNNPHAGNKATLNNHMDVVSPYMMTVTNGKAAQTS